MGPSWDYQTEIIMILPGFTLEKMGWENKQQNVFHWDNQCASSVFDRSFVYFVNWQGEKEDRQKDATNCFIGSLLISHFQVLGLSRCMTEQSVNNELQTMWKEMVVAFCKALACCKWRKPRTTQWVSRPRFKPPTFQIKIQRQITVLQTFGTTHQIRIQTNDSSSLPGYYVTLNSIQQYSASIVSVYMPLAELLGAINNRISKLLRNNNIPEDKPLSRLVWMSNFASFKL